MDILVRAVTKSRRRAFCWKIWW